MIFLTLGTQLPFDRLVRSLDTIAGDLNEEVFGQIGASAYKPANFPSVDFLAPAVFAERMAAARVIVSHAGIGTILTGVKVQKPLVLMARKAALGEHRNNHQLATVAQLRRMPGIHIVEDGEELRCCLSDPALEGLVNGPTPALERLMGTIRTELGLERLGQ